MLQKPRIYHDQQCKFGRSLLLSIVRKVKTFKSAKVVKLFWINGYMKKRIYIIQSILKLLNCRVGKIFTCPIYSGGNKFVIFCFALLLLQILDNFQNQGQFWNLLVLTISKHPLHVQFDQVLAEIFDVKDTWYHSIIFMTLNLTKFWLRYLRLKTNDPIL